MQIKIKKGFGVKKLLGFQKRAAAVKPLQRKCRVPWLRSQGPSIALCFGPLTPITTSFHYTSPRISFPTRTRLTHHPTHRPPTPPKESKGSSPIAPQRTASTLASTEYSYSQSNFTINTTHCPNQFQLYLCFLCRPYWLGRRGRYRSRRLSRVAPSSLFSPSVPVGFVTIGGRSRTRTLGIMPIVPLFSGIVFPFILRDWELLSPNTLFLGQSRSRITLLINESLYITDGACCCSSMLYVEGNLETKVFTDPITGLARRIREVAVRRNGNSSLYLC